jgi:hypothetical protein
MGPKRKKKSDRHTVFPVVLNRMADRTTNANHIELIQSRCTDDFT